MSWVIDDAPVPTTLFPVLMVIARRCDDQGRGSYQSVPTIAEKAGKSADQVKRDIRELKKLGLLTPGDESLVAHIEVWRRPAVYDLPLHVRGPKPVKESKNKSGGKGLGGGMDAPGGMDATGWHGCTQGGGMDALGGGGMDAPLIKPLNNPLNNPSLSAQDQQADVEAKTERENEDPSQNLNEAEPLRPEQKLIAKRGVSGDAVDYVCTWIDCRFAINGLGWWYTADRNGSLDQHIAEAMRAYAEDPYSPTPQTAHVPGSSYRLATNEIRSPADQRVADAMPLYEKYRALEQRERTANSRSVPELAAQKWAPTTSQ